MNTLLYIIITIYISYIISTPIARYITLTSAALSGIYFFIFI